MLRRLLGVWPRFLELQIPGYPYILVITKGKANHLVLLMDKVKYLKDRWFPELLKRKMGAVGISVVQETGQWAGVNGKTNEPPAHTDSRSPYPPRPYD